MVQLRPLVRLSRPVVVAGPRRWAHRLDPALVALLFLLDLLISWDRRPGGAFPEWVTPVYAAAGYLPLVWRRRSPALVLLIAVMHNLLAWLLVPGYVPALNVWCALFTVAFHCGRRTAVLGFLASLAPTALNVADEVRRATPDNRADALVVATVLGTLVDVAAFGAGRWAAWTAQRRRIDAERAAADAVMAERSRITRDLHDIVAHAVSLMVLQAAGAAKILHADPSRAETALRHVDELGQQAIVELRRMLGLLADTSGTIGPATPTAQPLPGLRNVDKLLDRVRAGDRQVELEVTGAPVPLDPGVDLSAYRILQEALTNSSRYADNRLPVHVALRWHPHELHIEIRDHGPAVRRSAPHPLSTGQGIIGMQERAAAVGGRLHAGVQPDGGFLVTVGFPLVSPPSGAGADNGESQAPGFPTGGP